MGTCASVTRDSESAMKMELSLGVNTDKLVKEKKQRPNGDRTVAEMVLKSQWSPPRSVASFRDYGSKEETFFDTKAWADSDCEDDFYSVNGDFTPSRGNTPVHHKFSNGTPLVNKALSEVKTPDSISIPPPSPSSTEKKNKLLDLFRESAKNDQSSDSSAATLTPTANSMCSSERTANEEPVATRDMSMRPAQGCLPSLRACGSFSERKKKTIALPPAIAVNVKS